MSRRRSPGDDASSFDGREFDVGGMRRVLLRWLAMASVVGLLGGCILLPPRENEQAAQAPFAHILPVAWEAISEWQPLNLDGDEEDEHLLFFRYDNGQVGALVVEGDPATSISTPDRLLPRNFDEIAALGQGVIAAPGTDVRDIHLQQVSDNHAQPELVILGGSTHLTFVWWKGANMGYGVTQLYANAGFDLDWESWQEEPTTITSIVGYEPLLDYRARADLCHLTLYTRRTDAPVEPAISFAREAQGLHFCGSAIPVYPFAPEGVVMAYIHWPRGSDAEMPPLLTPGTTLAQLDAESAAERWPFETIADIAAYRSLPLGQPATVTSLAPTTAVCVEFAERSNRTVRRWVVYTLRLQPADVQQRLPERWTVSGAFTEPQPVEAPPAGYCESILNRSSP